VLGSVNIAIGLLTYRTGCLLVTGCCSFLYVACCAANVNALKLIFVAEEHNISEIESCIKPACTDLIVAGIVVNEGLERGAALS
jgi:hypothetical protein